MTFASTVCRCAKQSCEHAGFLKNVDLHDDNVEPLPTIDAAKPTTAAAPVEVRSRCN